MKKENLKKILLISIFLLPLNTLAEDAKDPTPFYFALLFEAFCTIHMTVFVLKPLSKLIAKEDQDRENRIFWLLFLSRIVILLVLNPILPFIFIIDFMSIFIGAVIITPITIAKKTANLSGPIVSQTTSIINCPKCGYALNSSNSICPQCHTTIPADIKSGIINNKYVCKKCNRESDRIIKYCPYCGSNEIEPPAIQEMNIKMIDAAAGTPINKTEYADYLFEQSDDISLTSLVNEELQNKPEYKSLTLQSIENRKMIMTLIYCVITFIIIMIYVAYHNSLTLNIFIFSIITIIYIKIIGKYGLKKYIIKEAKSRPDEKISYITNSILSSATNNKQIYGILRFIILIVTFALPLFLFNKPHLIYEKVDGGYNLRYYTLGLVNQENTLTIPEIYKGESVIGIRGDVFKNVHSIETVNLPESIKEIRGGAFQNCYSLKSINLPSGITEIHGDTFDGCVSLESITIPDNVTRIGGHAFYDNSSLSEVLISENSKLNEIGSSAFRNCYNLYRITVPAETYVNERAFKNSPTMVYRYGEQITESEYGY